VAPQRSKYGQILLDSAGGHRPLHWTSAISDAPSFYEAIDQVSEQISSNLDGAKPEITLVFISSHHAPSYFAAPELFSSRFTGDVLVGCSASGVIGAGREIEGRPGVAVSAGMIPGAGIFPFHLNQDALPDADASPAAWHALFDVDPEAVRGFLLFPDPYTIRPDALISGLDFAFPEAIKTGGLVSGGSSPGTSALFSNGRVRRSGATGVVITGNVSLESVVARACRPIGRPMVVTEASENMLIGLDGEKALTALQSVFSSATARSQGQIRRSVQIGILSQQTGESDENSEYVVRNVLGMVEETGAVAIGDTVSEGSVVQFHVTDAESAEQDLRASLEDYVRDDDRLPESALMFSCLSLGKRLHGAPDHDTAIFQDLVAPVPLAGFFSNGEISTVDGHTRLYGYTTSFAMIREASRSEALNNSQSREARK
jgi:small ligand-binding sensory domain FIST